MFLFIWILNAPKNENYSLQQDEHQLGDPKEWPQNLLMAPVCTKQRIGAWNMPQTRHHVGLPFMFTMDLYFFIGTILFSFF